MSKTALGDVANDVVDVKNLIAMKIGVNDLGPHAHTNTREISDALTFIVETVIKQGG